ncbi:D-hexose-6-phosphate mutarotase [Guyparkeria sp. SCN-R1]|uniref:D-hexose-6-phosphate mutarotase n=1 Tax=Guyparkeria sp. SCN-R1 TaxID=2341113 RepID=UPI000F655A38|nr:D-hexose-6-phosphate mutarotase [Guyparkeria sp. SCN-R1]RRQ24051.1 D-hexose-6-phosphate mutarotase [Guyparkeria sp. SCN-R1]
MNPSATAAYPSRLGELETVELVSPHGRATVSCFGATVLDYRDSDGNEVLWLSPSSRLDGSRPVRGGIPVCWPWFGAHPSDSSLGAHGFVRHMTWQVERLSHDEDQALAVFTISDDETTRRIWPHAFNLTLTVILDDRLHLELTAENRSDQEWALSEALHSYFRVEDARGIRVDGLKGLTYWDKQEGGTRGIQSDPLQIHPPIDRVYFQHLGEAVINGPRRRIHIEKTGSASTVVWNPGPDGARSFDDIPDEAWCEMLCVETGNAIDNRYPLRPGERHTLSATIHTEKTTGNP